MTTHASAALTRIREVLPQGQTLPEDEWLRRHHAMVGVLIFEAIGLTVFSFAQGNGALHSVAHAGGLIPVAILALMIEHRRRLAAVLVSTGLITACALLVHIWDGTIEGHFLFFVTIVVLALYEDWLPFLVAAAYVVIHHGFAGVIDPSAVYNHPDAIAHPWKWAAIHGAFVAAAGVAAVAAWRMNETLRAEAQEAHRQTEDAAHKLAYQALHDELTTLPNRRSLFADLERIVPAASEESPVVLALFDLNGFEDYNDTYGHPAGDALLARVGKRLAETMEGAATAYRMGGDEFCILSRTGAGDAVGIAAKAGEALAEHGEGFTVTASYGYVLVPAEATTAQEAVRLADERMYVRKGLDSRASAGRQSADVLLSILSERNPALGVHLGRVTSYAEAVAKRLDLPDEQAAPMLQAASLHDTGKAAIPDEILHKPGVLDDDEWEFIRRHTEIGERILSAAPALRRAAKLVRSSHERFDGDGYPDRLEGEEIPLGARIIAVCDAYDAMLTERPYRRAREPHAALAELERCAGTQFDPEVVDAFREVLAEREDRAGAAVAQAQD